MDPRAGTMVPPSSMTRMPEERAAERAARHDWKCAGA